MRTERRTIPIFVFFLLLAIGVVSPEIRSADSKGTTTPPARNSLFRELEQIRKHFPGEMSIYTDFH